MPTFLNPKAIFLPHHAQHVVIIHFPLALFITGAVLDLLSRNKKDSSFAIAAYLNLAGASLSVFPALVTGLLAWRFTLAGQRLHGLLLLHLIGASVSSAIIFASWWVHRQTRRTSGDLLPGYRLFLEFLGVAFLAFTAHLGTAGSVE